MLRLEGMLVVFSDYCKWAIPKTYRFAGTISPKNVANLFFVINGMKTNSRNYYQSLAPRKNAKKFMKVAST